MVKRFQTDEQEVNNPPFNNDFLLFYCSQPNTTVGDLLEMIQGGKTLHDACEAVKGIPDEVCKKLGELGKISEVEDLCNNAVILKSVLRTSTLLTCLTFLCSFFYMT